MQREKENYRKVAAKVGTIVAGTAAGQMHLRFIWRKQRKNKAEDYFNSGMLVMNVKAFKDAKIEERFIHLLNTYCFSTVAPDQDYLNALCKNRVLHLPSSWNKMMMELA